MRTRFPSSAALALYGAVSFLFLGLRLLVGHGSQMIGTGQDAQMFIWAFGWYPHAIAHGLNPFETHILWAPAGVNLTWTTTVFGLSLLASPLTFLVGPFAAYNIVMVVLPALAAWTAFLLCRHLTGSVWPSLIGGYLFGFSSYMLGQSLGHTNLIAVFLVPLAALLVVRYVEGTLGGRGLMIRLGPLLALQLTTSTELIFTLTLATAGALILAFLLIPDIRPRLRSILGPLAGSYLVAGLITAPFLFYIAKGLHTAAYVPPDDYVADLANFVVPTDMSLVGTHWSRSFSLHLLGNDAENGAFLGLPLLVLLALFIWRHPRGPARRFLLAALFLTAFCALGPELHVDGHRTIPLPWRLVSGLPLWDNILPTRLMLYAWLVLAVIAALWCASQKQGSTRRWLLPALAIVAIAPNPWAAWTTRSTIPPFFTAAQYRHCLAPTETIMPIPISVGGNATDWQTAAGYRFRMAGGRIGQIPPTSFLHPSATIGIITNVTSPSPGQTGLLRLWIRAKQVDAVVVDPTLGRAWLPVLDRIAKRQEVGGIDLYRITASAPRCGVA